MHYRLFVIPIIVILIFGVIFSISIKSNASTPIQHVIVIMEENAALQQINSTSAPYMTQLANQYASTSNYTGIICCDSASEYLGITSGTQPSIDQHAGTFNVRNIGDLTSWKEYAESIPYSCDPNSGLPEGSQPYDLYLASHNPFPYFTDVYSSQSYCTSHVVGFSNSTFGFLHDLNNGMLPSFSFITPNGCDDAHNWITNCWQWCPSPSPDSCTNSTQLLNADQWLHWLVPQIIASPYWSSTAILITFDDNANNVQYPSDQVYATWVSPYSNMGYVSNHNYNHYNALSTFEYLLGLGNLGTNDSLSSPMTDMFNFNQTSSTSTTVIPTTSTLTSSTLTTSTLTTTSITSSSITSSSTSSSTTTTIPINYQLNVTVSGNGQRYVNVTLTGLPTQKIIPPTKFTIFSNLQGGHTYTVTAKISTGGKQTKLVTMNSNQTVNFSF